MNKYRPWQLAFVATSILGLVACALTDIDAPSVSSDPDAYWFKQGVSNSKRKIDGIECAKDAEAVTVRKRLNGEDECMLKKGYTFVPRPSGFRNLCDTGAGRDRFACRYLRGEVTVQPDPAEAPIRPESNTRSNASSSLWNLLITPSGKPTHPTESELQLQQLQKQIGNAPLPPPPKPFK